MEAKFCRISLLSTSKQLNTETSVLLNDLREVKQKLNADVLDLLQKICNETLDVDYQSHHDTMLNLCHLIGLMITYECCIVLRSITQCISHTHTQDCCPLSFFQRQLNRMNRTKHSPDDRSPASSSSSPSEPTPAELLDHTIDRCKEHSPIILYHDCHHHGHHDHHGHHHHSNATTTHSVGGPSTPSTPSYSEENKSAVSTHDLSISNNKIYTKCKLERATRCPLRGIASRSLSSLTISTSHSGCSSPSSEEMKAPQRLRSERERQSVKHSKNPKEQKGRRGTVRIPKTALSEFASKNYHKCGRRHNLPTYSMAEIAKHRSIDDCWILVDGLVLDVTGFLPHHPASYQCILRKAGQSCDVDFKFHSKSAQHLFWKFVIGRVQRESSCLVM